MQSGVRQWVAPLGGKRVPSEDGGGLLLAVPAEHSLAAAGSCAVSPERPQSAHTAWKLASMMPYGPPSTPPCAP